MTVNSRQLRHPNQHALAYCIPSCSSVLPVSVDAGVSFPRGWSDNVSEFGSASVAVSRTCCRHRVSVQNFVRSGSCAYLRYKLRDVCVWRQVETEVSIFGPDSDNLRGMIRWIVAYVRSTDHLVRVLWDLFSILA